VKEVLLGQIIASNHIKEGDRIVCYSTSPHIFVGNYKRVLPSNSGLVVDVELMKGDVKFTSRLELEASSLIAVGKLVGEYGVQTIDDGQLNEEISKYDNK